MLPIDTTSTIKEIVINIVIGREKNGYPISFIKILPFYVI